MVVGIGELGKSNIPKDVVVGICELGKSNIQKDVLVGIGQLGKSNIPKDVVVGIGELVDAVSAQGEDCGAVRQTAAVEGMRNLLINTT